MDSDEALEKSSYHMGKSPELWRNPHIIWGNHQSCDGILISYEDSSRAHGEYGDIL
eukprot:UN05969